MSVRTFEEHTPSLHATVFVDASAVVLGQVRLGRDSSVWPNATVRGDIQAIHVGERTNIQDGAVLHVTHASEFVPGGRPLVIGSDVTIGHNATLHACTIGDACLVGMNAVILDGAVLENEVMVAAHALVPPGKTLEGGFLYAGSPVKQMRPLTESETRFLRYSAEHYITLKERHRRHSHELNGNGVLE